MRDGVGSFTVAEPVFDSLIVSVGLGFGPEKCGRAGRVASATRALQIVLHVQQECRAQDVLCMQRPAVDIWIVHVALSHWYFSRLQVHWRCEYPCVLEKTCVAVRESSQCTFMTPCYCRHLALQVHLEIL